MTTPKPASHPPSCRTCTGTGWQPGPPIPSIANGHHFAYSTVEPCRNDWYVDDPTVDEHGLDRTEPISFAEYMSRLTKRLERDDPAAKSEWNGWQLWGVR